jgi:cytochrome c oxidase cbb3-type subunit IV
MFKYYFEQIDNVAIWPLISLTIFFTFFIGLLMWVWKVDKSFINKMKNLPLEDDITVTKATTNHPKL